MKPKIVKMTLVLTFAFSLFALPYVIYADSLSLVSRTILTNYPWGVSKKNNILYVPNRGTISIVEISNPYLPIHIKDHDPGAGSTSALATFIQDTILYSRGDPTFFTVNIKDSVNPVNLSELFIVGSSSNNPRSLYVNNNNCYIALTNKGVSIFGVTDPLVPESLGTYDTPGYAYDVFVRDTLAYIADQDSFRIANVSNPSTIVRVGAVYTPGWCSGVTVNGNYAYLACTSTNGYNGCILSVDVSDPSNPVLADQINSIQGDPLTVYYSNNYIYCIAADYVYKKEKGDTLRVGCKQKATVEGGLRVINVAKPDSIYYTCGFNTFSDPRDAIAESGYVYIADQDSGLVILKHNITGVEGLPEQEPIISGPQITIYPNPCKQTTTINYQLTKPEHVTIKIYNIGGQLVKNLVDTEKKAGRYTILWNCMTDKGQRVSGGVYFCEMASGGNKEIRKIMVVK
jgi:hypothetical protein